MTFDLDGCRAIKIDVSETLNAKVGEPDDAARKLNVRLYHRTWENEEDLANDNEVVHELGSLQIWIFDPFAAIENHAHPACMIDAHSQDAVNMFYMLFKDDLFDSAFKGSPFRMLVHDNIHELIDGGGFVSQEKSDWFHIAQANMEELTEDEMVLVLGRLFETYTDEMTIISMLWQPAVDKVKLGALKRTMHKVVDAKEDGLLFVEYGGLKSPHNTLSE